MHYLVVREKRKSKLRIVTKTAFSMRRDCDNLAVRLV